MYGLDYDMIEDIGEDQPRFIKCEKCGGWGYYYGPAGASAQRCDSCHGDKRSRNPKHYRK